MVKIFGIYDETSTKNRNKKLIVNMFKSFEFGHHNYKIFPEYGVGHIRIPTMNRTGIASSKNVTVCFSGQLFEHQKNQKERKITDEKYILNEYLKDGLNFVKKLNGVFVFTIYDKNKKTVYIINDRYGMKSVYFYADKKKIIFSSEIKAILEENRIKKIINWNFWKDYFAYGFPLGNKTPISSIYNLSNASILSYHDGTVKIEKYWDYENIKIDYKRSEEETIMMGTKILKKIFQRYTKNLKKCQVMLSGGYDSRCIAASIKKYGNVDFKTYTSASHPSGRLDTIYAKKISDILEVDNIRIDNSNKIYEENFIDHIKQLDGMCFEHMWIMPILKKTSSDRINFDGIIGDVLMRAGWLAMRELDDQKNDKKQLAKNIHNVMIRESLVDSESVRKYFKKDIIKKIINSHDEVYEELQKINNIGYTAKIFLLNNRTKNIINLASNNLMIRKFYSLFPFADNEFVEFALSIPPEMKIQKNIYLKILKNSYPEVMGTLTTNDAHTIKEKIKSTLIKNDMHNILKIAKGINNQLKIIAKNTYITRKRKLSENKNDVIFLINLIKKIDIPKYIKKDKLLRDIQNHLKKDQDPSYFLEPILRFIVWENIFIQNKNLK